MSDPGISPIAPSPVVLPPAVEKKCGQCGKVDEAMKRCSKCHLTPYCNRDCQVKNWPSHKQVCGKANGEAPKANWEIVADKLNARLKKEFDQWTPDKPVIMDLSAFGRPPCFFQSRKDYWIHFIQKTGVKTDPFFEYFYKKSLQRQKGKALDLGCFGIGGNTHFLLQMGWKVTAVNFCEEVLELMRRSAKLRNQKELVLTNADINDYAFPEKVDLILAIDILPYTNPKKICDLLQKIQASLNENGYLVGSFFIGIDSLKALQEITRAGGGWFFDDPETVRSLFTDLHFKIVEFNYTTGQQQASVDFVVQKI